MSLADNKYQIEICTIKQDHYYIQTEDEVSGAIELSKIIKNNGYHHFNKRDGSFKFTPVAQIKSIHGEYIDKKHKQERVKNYDKQKIQESNV